MRVLDKYGSVKMLMSAPHHHLSHQSSGADAVQLEVGFYAYLATAQDNLIDDTWTTVLLDTLLFNLGGGFNLETHRFVAPASGYYLLSGSVGLKNIIVSKAYGVSLLKNSTAPALVSASVANGEHATDPIYQSTCFVHLNWGDWVELRVVANCGVDTVDLMNKIETTWFAGYLVSPT